MKKLVLVGAVAVLGLGASANAASVVSLMHQVVNSAAYGPADLIRPVVFEDNDFSRLVDVDGDGRPSVGDKITGIIQIQSLTAGIPTNTLVASAINNQIPPNLLLAAGGNNDLSAAYELDIVSFGPGAQINLGVPTTYTQALAGLGALPAGTVIAVYEDTNSNFTSNVSFATDVANATTAGGGASLFAAIGFSGVGTEFYTIVPVSAGAIAETVELSLNFLSGITGFDVTKNSLGTDLYGFGTLSVTTGSHWDRTSDVDFVVLHTIPTPAAAWAGLVLLGGLGAARLRRSIRI